MHSCTLVHFNTYTLYCIKCVIIKVICIMVLRLQRRLMKVQHVLSSEWVHSRRLSTHNYYSPGLFTKNLIFNKMEVFQENESFKRDPTIQKGQILVSLHMKHTMQENKTTYIHAKLSNLLQKYKPFSIL